MINIKPKENWIISLENEIPITEETRDKMTAHLDRIIVCAKDLGINFAEVKRKNGTNLYIHVEKEESATEEDIKVFKSMCGTLLDFIERLPMPEPEPAIDAPAQPIDVQVSKNLKFCKSVLEEYDGTKDEFSIIGAIVYCGSDDKEIAMPCGCINRKLFKELLTLYVEKYGNGNYNQAKPAKSTAS